MSNIVPLHLTSSGEYSTFNKYPSNEPINHPIKSEFEADQTVLIGSVCGALIMIGIILWLGIWYIRNQRGTFKSTGKKSTIEIGLVNETTESSTPPSTIQREAETLKRHLMQPQMTTVIEPNTNPNGTPVYWSASQLLDNNNLGTCSMSTIHDRGSKL